MANIIIPSFNYTYPGLLSTDLIYLPSVMNPDTLSLFRVRPNIRSKDQLHLINPLGKTVQGDQGCGTKTVTGAPITMTNRTLEVCILELYLEQCADVFEGTVYETLLMSGVNTNNLTGTQIEGIIRNLLVTNLQQEFFRIFSFGDTTSPAGDPSYYGMCDGLWSRLFAGEASYAVPKIDSITALAASDIQGYFKRLHTQSNILLKQIPADRKAFYVTGNVWEGLLDYYETKESSNGFTSREEDGVQVLRYRGSQVIPLYAWDKWIDVDNLGNNSRILYTTQENHVIGVDNPADQGQVKIYFDEDDELVKIKAKARMGYNYVADGLQAISYGNVT